MSQHNVFTNSSVSSKYHCNSLQTLHKNAWLASSLLLCETYHFELSLPYDATVICWKDSKPTAIDIHTCRGDTVPRYRNWHYVQVNVLPYHVP
jgi:hypothetical protein